MATYKVLQDIEAEDKLIGPLTLRQFVYAAIAVAAAFIAFKISFVNIFLILPFIPIIILFAVLAVPFGHDQPNEVWLLAQARFLLKPHKRIWNKGGISSSVTITAPKRQAIIATKAVSESDAVGRLERLARTIDSRGWAVKNVNVNLSNTPDYESYASDRLVRPVDRPQDVPNYDITAADDILDPQNNPIAKRLGQMMSSSTESYKQSVIDNMLKDKPKQSPRDQKPWFKPASNQRSNTQTKKTSSASPKTKPSTDPAILGIALNNKDNWTVSTTARELNKAKEARSSDGEVSISIPH